MPASTTVVIPAQAGIQHAAAFRLNLSVSGILDRPPEPVIGRRESDRPVADDDSCDARVYSVTPGAVI